MNMTMIAPRDKLENPMLWKDFTCEKLREARLVITGLGLYRAFLNGKRIGEDYLTPGCNDYDDYLRCREYDVTKLLRKRNRLTVWLGNGWYKGRFGLDNGCVDRWGKSYLLAAQLTVDGKTLLETDKSWLASRSPVTFDGIYDGEARDDTLLPGEPIPCIVVKTRYPLEMDKTAPIRVRAKLKPKKLITEKGEIVLDFGQNMAGVFRFVNRLPKGASLYIQTGEVLQEGCFYRDNLRSAKSEFHYVSDGVVKEVEPTFTFYGFRYLKLVGWDDVDPKDFTALALCSDLRETLCVTSGHKKLNRLMENALWGQRSNFLDVPTDCPQRDERLGWTADTQVFVNTACYQMDCKAFYRKFMRDMRIDQTRYYQGDIPEYSPSLKGAAGHGGAVWADAGTIIPWNVYQNYGDKALLRENYPMMTEYVDTLIAADKRLGGTHVRFDAFTFGDWLAQDGLTPQSVFGGTKPEYIQGVYYMNSVRLCALAARELGLSEDAKKYAALESEIKQALLDEYVTPGGNLSVDTQTAYVLALKYGLYRGKDKLLAGFRGRLRRDFYKIKCGFTGAPLMLPVLFDNGFADEAFRMLLREDFPGWLYCVNLGATTVWERWNSLNSDGSISGTGMNSLNHYAYGSVCEAIYSRVAGLRAKTPGWRSAIVAPQLSGRIGSISLRYDSPAGLYGVAWVIAKDGGVRLTVTVPKGAQAEVILPDHPQALTETVDAGTHTYEWTPTRDYLHPFSESSLVMDLLDNERAAALLKKYAPQQYAELQAGESELPLKSAGELSLPRAFYTALQKVKVTRGA